jgi:uncharacterized membrane-anchored protein YhcB (DUF1043 family)
MSLTSREFFDGLEDGQQYLSCFTTEEAYALIPKEVQEQMLINEIRQTNDAFKEDDMHRALKKDYNKAKSALRNYEFDKNHKG